MYACLTGHVYKILETEKQGIWAHSILYSGYNLIKITRNFHPAMLDFHMTEPSKVWSHCFSFIGRRLSYAMICTSEGHIF